MLRDAHQDDVPFILRLTQQGAAQGHFGLETSDEKVSGGFSRELEQILASGHRPYRNLKAELYIWEANGAPAGFAMLSEILPGVGTEILALAMDETFRGGGHGAALLDALLNGPLQDQPVYARCHPESQRLYEMLMRRGFDHRQDGEHGVRFLVRKTVPASTNVR